MWRKGNPGTLLLECKLVQPLCKTVWNFLQKLKIELQNDPAIPLLGIYLKKTKTLIQKDTCTLMFMAALFTIAKVWKQQKCPSTDEWINRSGIYTHTHNGIQSAIKKNKIFPFAASGMDLEGIMLSEICQTEKDKYCMISFTCGI